MLWAGWKISQKALFVKSVRMVVSEAGRDVISHYDTNSFNKKDVEMELFQTGGKISDYLNKNYVQMDGKHTHL